MTTAPTAAQSGARPGAARLVATQGVPRQPQARPAAPGSVAPAGATPAYGPRPAAAVPLPRPSSVGPAGPAPVGVRTTAAAHPQRRASRLAGDVLLILTGIVLGVLLAATVTSPAVQGWSQPGGVAYAVGALAAVIGTYGVLVLLVLVARIPVLERAVGQDRLVRWHRRLAPWALGLIGVHVVATVAGSAAGSSWFGELWAMVTSVRWILPALVGAVLMLVATVTSWRVARRRLAYGTWWTVHLYTYLAIALAFAHQLTLGTALAHGWARTLWLALYAIVGGAILGFRVGLPVIRSYWHDLRVDRVVPEGPGVVSVIVRGRRLDRLDVRGGQFFAWRFWAPGLRWEAHPYSISGAPRAGLMRITVKDLGDASGSVARLRPGTRVLAEGPYGTFTLKSRTRPHVVLIAAGVGVAPMRAMLDDVPPGVTVDVLFRARTHGDLVLRRELDAIARRPATRVKYLVGRRDEHPLDARMLARLVPGIADADVFVCGPDALTERIAESAGLLGVPPERIHSEAFAW